MIVLCHVNASKEFLESSTNLIAINVRGQEIRVNVKNVREIGVGC